MSISLEKLDKDYLKFDEANLPYPLSKCLLTPILHIKKTNGKYTLYLGAKIKKSGKVNFISCLSIAHNWLWDGSRIKPLPHDITAIVNHIVGNTNPLELTFPKILHLIRKEVEGIEIEVDPLVFEKANACSLGMSIPSELPELKANLYPYQEHGVGWMLEAINSLGGVILADEMGLGKTLQIIAIFLLQKPTNVSPALIICPTTLIANWCREIKRFAPSLTVLVHGGTGRTGFYKELMRSQIVISTYDTLVNDISMFKGVEWSFLICDEAQAAKNPESKRRRALGEIPRRFTIPVTGTPMENSLMDLWSLGDLAIPGILGSKENFSLIYPDTEQGALELTDVVDTFILKRQVKDVASDLPDRTDIDFPVELDDASLEEYEKIRIDAISQYGPAGQLVAVGQLAIYCAHPWLRLKDSNNPDWEDNVGLQQDPKYQLATPKMKVCIHLLKEAFLTGKKVLIFAAYNHCGELIQKAAALNNVPQGYWNKINGSTPQTERQAIVDEFTCHDGPAVLVLNPKAAGSGLNITAATIVIHYTQNWNPALEMQASARAHRRGQTQPVTIYRLYYQGTVEETMIERSQWKRELSNIAVPINTREKADLNKALKISPSMEHFK
jgi:SNF2 family DNA or RNA helicase